MRRSLLLFFLLVSYLSSAQVDQLVVSYDAKGQTVQKVLEALEDEYGVRFSYATSQWLSDSLDMNFHEQPLGEVLDYMLDEQGLEYREHEGSILVRKGTNYEVTKGDQYRRSIHLQGKVMTADESDAPLPYAMISVPGTSVGTYSDSLGNFDLEIPTALLPDGISIQFLGYKSYHYEVMEAPTEFIVVQLEEDSYALEEIQIVNRRKKVRFGTADQVVTVRGSMDRTGATGPMGADINRAIQLLPGITAHDDDSAEIKIRGSNSDQTMVILDGMPLYSTNHYHGIFSNLQTQYIDSINVFKNNYPIYYDGKAAGLVEIFSEREHNNSTSAQIGLDLMTMQTMISTPLSDAVMLTVAGRSTLRSIGNNQFNTISTFTNATVEVQNFSEKLETNVSNPEASFYDVNANLSWTPNKNNSLQLNVFKSADSAINAYEVNARDNRNDRVMLEVDEQLDWSTAASSVLWSSRLSKRISLHSRGFYSQFASSVDDELTIKKSLRDSNGMKPNVKNPDGVTLSGRQANEVTDTGLDTHIHYRKDKTSLRLGAAAGQQHVDYGFRENQDQVINGNTTIPSAALYGSYSSNIWKGLSVAAALRSTYYGGNLNQVYFSPRLNTSYKITDKISVKAAYNQYQQVLRQFYYEYRSEPLELWVLAGDNDIPVLSAQGFMLGSTLRLGRFTIDVEAFRKHLEGTTEYAVLTPAKTNNNPNTAEDYRLFVGEGLMRGIDVIASFGISNYDTYLSYTLSKSEEKYRDINKFRYYDAENDRRHQVKWINKVQLGQWSFDANAIYSSGRPYTNTSSVDDIGDIRDEDPRRRLSRLPAYTRVDLGTSYTLNLGKSKATVSLSVFNLLNTQNVKYIQSVVTELSANDSSTNTVIGTESALLNRTINVGVNFSF